MNKKDYNAIAGIIKGYVDISCKGSLSCALADYFEKEDKENQPTKGVWNKEEFLKTCGVEE